MTLKEKFNSIDQSRITADQKSFLDKMKNVTKDFTLENKEVNEKVEGALDKMITSFKEKMPDAIKTTKKVVAPKKAKEKKTVVKTSGGKRTIMSVAKDIRKEGESWKDAQKRASDMLKKDKSDVSKVVETELQKLSKFIKGRKELEGLSGTDLKRDSHRTALPKGRRLSKEGNVYYENRDNRTDRLAPNYPKDAPLLELGGGVDFYEQLSVYVQGVGSIYSGTSMKKAIDKAREYEKKNKNAEIVIVDEKYGDEYDTDGNFINEYEVGGGVFKIYYEVGIDEGDSGTRTIAEFESEKEAKKFIYDYNLKNPKAKLFIDSITSDLKYGQFAKGGGIRKKNGQTYDFGSVWTNDHNQFDKDSEHEVNYRKRKRFELGGTVVTDLAGNTSGGDLGLNAGMPLSGFSNTAYTGLVGETGAMSSGEMFENGGGIGKVEHYPLDKDKLNEYAEWWADRIKSGTQSTTKKNLTEKVEEYKQDLFLLEIGRKKPSNIIGTGYKGNSRKLANTWLLERIYETNKVIELLGDKFEFGGGLPAGAEQSYVNYYLGEGTAQGIYKDGGSIPNNYEGKTAKDVWNNLSTSQRHHFLHDHNESEIKSTPMSIEDFTKKSYNFLPTKVKKSFENHVRTGQYATGGMLNANERYVLEIKGLTGLRKEAIESYISENKLSDNDVLNIVVGLGRKQLKGTDVASAVVGKKGNSLSKEIIQFGKDNKGMKLEEGGNIDAFTLRMVKGNAGNPDEVMTESRSVQFVKGGVVSQKEKREKYLDNLSMLESEVFDKIGANSGGEIRQNETLLRKYAEGVGSVMEKEGVGYGSFDEEDYEYFVDENAHLFNEFLVWNNYYEPTMTKKKKAWRLKMYNEDVKKKGKSTYISNPNIITLNSTKRKSEKPNKSEKKYILHADIKSVKVYKGSKVVTYSGKDVLNGANILKNGGGIQQKAYYIPKREVVEVELKNGETVKPANGYWIKKDAKQSFETGGDLGIEEEIDLTDDNRLRVKELTYEYKKPTAKELAEKHNSGAYEFMEEDKMMSGGKTKKGNGEAMQLAKKIRKDGEKWTDAVKRAWSQLK